MKVGDLVRKKYRQYHVLTAASFKSNSAHIVTETRINWIKVLAHGESVGWLREDDWELVNEAG
jgi:hypothetical protein